MQNTHVCFVNTEQEPIKIKRLGLFRYIIKDSKLILGEFCELFYPHPDAPEDATVSIYRDIEVSYPHGTDSLITHAIDAGSALQRITALKWPQNAREEKT